MWSSGFVFFFFFSVVDIWERDLVELVFEVPVSQVTQHQRDMLLRQVGVLLGVLDSDIIVREISAFNEHRWGINGHIFYLFYLTFTNFIFIHPLLPLLSTRLVFLVSGGPGRPPLSGHSVALGLRNKLHKQKNDFLIFKARRVDTVSEYWQVAAKMFVTSLYNFIIIIIQ